MSVSIHMVQKMRLLRRQILRSYVEALSPLDTGPCSIFSRNFTTQRARRRKRPNYGIGKMEGTGPPKQAPSRSALDAPYSYGGADGSNTEEYLKKTSLSPWVPIPDPIARKLFDMTEAGPDDIHVDLGCGDGRVNFYAIDHGKVKKSTGIDIDEGILEKSKERLRKRYPPPPVEFIQADLLDPDHEVWEKIQEATIITMYFVGDALQKIRPILEEKLAGKHCKIITCSYEMKGWMYTMMETTLGITVYLYNWGKMDDEDTPFFDDDILIEKPKELMEDPLEKLRVSGLDVTNIEHVRQSFIPDRNNPDYDEWIDDSDSDDEQERDTSKADETFEKKTKQPVFGDKQLRNEPSGQD